MFEGSVHSEALNANAFRDCKRQCDPNCISILLTSRCYNSPYQAYAIALILPLKYFQLWQNCSTTIMHTKIWGISTKTEMLIKITSLVAYFLSFTFLAVGRTWSFGIRTRFSRLFCRTSCSISSNVVWHVPYLSTAITVAVPYIIISRPSRPAN